MILSEMLLHTKLYWVRIFLLYAKNSISIQEKNSPCSLTFRIGLWDMKLFYSRSNIASGFLSFDFNLKICFVSESMEIVYIPPVLLLGVFEWVSMNHGTLCRNMKYIFLINRDQEVYKKLSSGKLRFQLKQSMFSYLIWDRRLEENL